MYLGDGDNIAFGGGLGDIIESGAGQDIILGDFGLFQDNVEQLWDVIEVIDCEHGGNDTIQGGNGTNIVIGGAFDDEVDVQDGSDLVLGDHGKVFLYESPAYKLFNVTTTHATCTPGEDRLYLGDGDNIAFGGALGDIIRAGAGQDIILGDFGLYRDLVEFLPNQFFESITDFYDIAGPDVINGGDGDDIIMGQEFDDIIEGGGGSDDLYGGHHKLFGEFTTIALFRILSCGTL